MEVPAAAVSVAAQWQYRVPQTTQFGANLPKTHNPSYAGSLTFGSKLKVSPSSRCFSNGRIGGQSAIEGGVRVRPLRFAWMDRGQLIIFIVDMDQGQTVG